MIQTITPCLWFDNQAEEAVSFYASIFQDAKVLEVARYGEAGPGEPGTVMTISFELNGQRFVAINGGPVFKFTPAVSFQVLCETQAEIDRLWERLTEGGSTSQCGWLEDRYGLSWQIVPAILGSLMTGANPARAEAVTLAMLTMTKLDIAELRRAYDEA